MDLGGLLVHCMAHYPAEPGVAHESQLLEWIVQTCLRGPGLAGLHRRATARQVHPEDAGRKLTVRAGPHCPTACPRIKRPTVCGLRRGRWQPLLCPLTRHRRHVLHPHLSWLRHVTITEGTLSPDECDHLTPRTLSSTPQRLGFQCLRPCSPARP